MKKAPEQQVNRFEVIDHRLKADPVGRVYSVRPCSIEFSYQDDGKTLKVFVNDPK